MEMNFECASSRVNVCARVMDDMLRYVTLTFYDEDEDLLKRGRVRVGRIEWKEVDGKTLFYPEGRLEIEMQAAQQLMDNLWDCGLRPTGGIIQQALDSLALALADSHHTWTAEQRRLYEEATRRLKLDRTPSLR